MAADGGRSIGNPEANRADPDEDGLLLVRIAARDEVAFRRLAEQHIGGLLMLARRILRDESEAEDIVQEALLRLWRTSPDLRSRPVHVGGWLRRVTANLAVDRLRARKRFDVTDDLPEVVDAPGQHVAIEEQDLSARVGAAIARLAERQRVALTLFHYEGLSLAEVAHMMQLSQEAVESLLARARRALKAALKDEWRALMPDRED